MKQNKTKREILSFIKGILIASAISIPFMVFIPPLPEGKLPKEKTYWIESDKSSEATISEKNSNIVAAETLENSDWENSDIVIISENPSEISSNASSSFEEEHKDEISILSRIIYAEAGNVEEMFPDEDSNTWQQYVGYVVMNRVMSNHFPNSIEAVLYQNGQYADSTLKSVESGVSNDQSIKNATVVLRNYYAGTIPVPNNMVYQAEFPQGKPYAKIGNTYFGTTE